MIHLPDPRGLLQQLGEHPSDYALRRPRRREYTRARVACGVPQTQVDAEMGAPRGLAWYDLHWSAPTPKPSRDPVRLTAGMIAVALGYPPYALP